MRQLLVFGALLSTALAGAREPNVSGYANEDGSHIAIDDPDVAEGPIVGSIRRSDGSGPVVAINGTLHFGFADIPTKLAPNQSYVLTLEREGGSKSFPFVVRFIDECWASPSMDLDDAGQRHDPPALPFMEELQIGEGGFAIAELKLGHVERGTLGRLVLSDTSGRRLWTGLGSVNGIRVYVCPRFRGHWPDRVVAEMTFVDLTGRTSSTMRAEVPVVQVDAFPAGWVGPATSPKCTGCVASTVERVLLFAAVPLLIGWLAGSIFGRRRRR
jgi:hypothetical protein